MVTPYGVLDALIAHTTLVPATAMTFLYEVQVEDLADVDAPGEYGLDNTAQRLNLGLADSNGLALPMLQAAQEVVLEYRNAFNQADNSVVTIVGSTLTGTRVEILFLGPMPSLRRGSRLSVSFTIAGANTSRTYWAKRRDFDAKDQLEFTNGGLAGAQVLNSRWLVRGLPAGRRWTAGDQFADEDGREWTVEGTAEMGRRGEFLELSARRVT